jgi:hypothetical protein
MYFEVYAYRPAFLLMKLDGNLILTRGSLLVGAS